jgi:hypothetical protein
VESFGFGYHSVPKTAEERSRVDAAASREGGSLFARSMALLVRMEGGRESREPWEALIRLLDARS